MEELINPYNTDVVFDKKRDLKSLGYVSVWNLPVGVSKNELLHEAKKTKNTLAIFSGGYESVFIKKDFLDKFILSQQKKVTSITLSGDEEFMRNLSLWLRTCEGSFNLKEVPAEHEVKKNVSDEEKVKFLKSKYREVFRDIRLINSLVRLDLEFVFEVAEYDARDFFKCRGYSRVTASKLEHEFAQRGLILGDVPLELIQMAKK